MRPGLRLIVWPAYLPEPLLWAASDGRTWVGGQFPGAGHEALPGQPLGGFAFARWHQALLASLSWARCPARPLPRGWRHSLLAERRRVIDAGRLVGSCPPA